MAMPAVLCRHGRCFVGGWVRADVRVRVRVRFSGGGRTYVTDAGTGDQKGAATTAEEEKTPGAMSRRLAQATEDALLTGGRRGRRAVEEAGFDEALKERLLRKIAAAPAPGVSSAAASASALHAPWIGEEEQSAAVLRMLQDAHKPLAPGLRGKPRTQSPSSPPVVVDMRLRRAADAAALSPGQRLSAARDKATAYGIDKMVVGGGGGSGGSGGSGNPPDAEREERQRLLRERFGLAARRGGAMPTTMTGLAALANERIEAAMSGGRFADVAVRGPGVAAARDPRVDSPFVDTTEFLMNRVLQRQELVPPWIEKQQDLARAAQRFRAQLRTSWRRHAARTVASRGGTLAAQLAVARQYARAEAVHNPRPRDVEGMAVPVAAGGDGLVHRVAANTGRTSTGRTSTDTDNASSDAPLRDPAWEAAEHAYHERAVAELNALARSYNLMAPALAKKPYFSLERERRACYADVAPTLAEAIRDRAAPPSGRNLADGPGAGTTKTRSSSALARLAGDPARVRDSPAPHYGLRALWRDLWK